MVNDVAGKEIKSGDLVVYSVSSGDLRLGIVTGVSAKIKTPANYPRKFLPWIDLVQVTSLNKKKLIKKWHRSYNNFLVVPLETLSVEQITDFYKLESQMEQFIKNNNQVHERDVANNEV